MNDGVTAAPDSTAVRVALWRALHVQIDPAPYVLEDEIGLRLAAPGEDWRRRPDMDPDFTRPFRAAIVARKPWQSGATAPPARRPGPIPVAVRIRPRASRD